MARLALALLLALVIAPSARAQPPTPAPDAAPAPAPEEKPAEKTQEKPEETPAEKTEEKTEETAVSAPPPAPGQPEPIRLALVVSSDLDGALAPATCRPGASSAPNIGHLAAAEQLAEEQARAHGRTVVASVHLGDFTGAAALGRYLFAQPDGPKRLAALVARTGFHFAIPGNNWLDQPAGKLSEFADALAADGVTVLNANVKCDKRPDCAQLQKMPRLKLVEAAGVKVALIGVTNEDILQTIDPEDRKGLEVTPLTQALQDAATEARAQGADVVVAFSHVVGGKGIAFIEKTLRDAAGVDLVVANQLGILPETSAALQPAHGPALAVAGATPTGAVRISFDVVRRQGRLQLERLGTDRVEATAPEPKLARDVESLIGDFCRALDEPLAARAVKPTPRKEFLQFLLDEMRDASHAEVGLVNEEIADADAFPLSGEISTADLFAALPYDDALVKASMTGSRLRSVWKASAERAAQKRPGLVWAGVAEKDGQVLVNGRPLDDSSRYSVAMPDYVARGGDALVGDPLDFESVTGEDDQHVHIRELALQALSDPERRLELPLKPTLDLTLRPRWTWSYGATLSGADTELRNQAKYPDPRLARTNAALIRGEVTGRVDADARDHLLRLTGRARYGYSTVEPSETEDQIYAETLYRLRAAKRLWNEAWYAPVPYVSGTLDTEFVPNPGASFRHFEVGATVGVRLLPVRPLELKVGVGARNELLDRTSATRFGLEAGYELPRFQPAHFRGLPIDLESRLDYFVSDLTGVAQHEGKLSLRLLLPLGGPLSVNTGVDVLVLKGGGQPYAFVSDATLGITARFDGAKQQF